MIVPRFASFLKDFVIGCSQIAKFLCPRCCFASAFPARSPCAASTRRQFPGASSLLREFAGFKESCGGDVEEELVLEFDDSPGTTKGTYFSVLQRMFFPSLVRCGVSRRERERERGFSLADLVNFRNWCARQISRKLCKQGIKEASKQWRC